MAENEAGLSAETSSGGSRGTMSARSVPGKRAFGKISLHVVNDFRPELSGRPSYCLKAVVQYEETNRS
jgi:hypothetical protein